MAADLIAFYSKNATRWSLHDDRHSFRLRHEPKNCVNSKLLGHIFLNITVKGLLVKKTSWFLFLFFLKCTGWHTTQHPFICETEGFFPVRNKLCKWSLASLTSLSALSIDSWSYQRFINKLTAGMIHPQPSFKLTDNEQSSDNDCMISMDNEVLWLAQG